MLTAKEARGLSEQKKEESFALVSREVDVCERAIRKAIDRGEWECSLSLYAPDICEAYRNAVLDEAIKHLRENGYAVNGTRHSVFQPVHVVISWKGLPAGA